MEEGNILQQIGHEYIATMGCIRTRTVTREGYEMLTTCCVQPGNGFSGGVVGDRTYLSVEAGV